MFQQPLTVGKSQAVYMLNAAALGPAWLPLVCELCEGSQRPGRT